MRIVCVGGGPAGLSFAMLLKRSRPAFDIIVVERNRPDDTFGWGVVFSDATMERLRIVDPETASAIANAFHRWDDIDVRIHGRSMRTTGHGFAGIGRHQLLRILQDRCREYGVTLAFEHQVASEEEFPDADLIIACDGVNSALRTRHADVFQPELELRPNRYIWLGVERPLDAFTFDFQHTEHGWFQAHMYRFDDTMATCIVETTDAVYHAHGLDQMSVAESIAFCERVFSDVLGGASLISNDTHLQGSPWRNFIRLSCGAWRHTVGRTTMVLMGDAAHTAHFAIGAGTRLALEDGIELAAQLAAHMPESSTSGITGATSHNAISRALDAYEAVRRVDVLRIQNAARNAMEWFEVVGDRYAHSLEPEQFMYSLLTRSQRISHENLRLRDPAWVSGYEQWFAVKADSSDQPVPPPMFTPFRLRDTVFPNRVVVSPMDMYSAENGNISDFHLVHLGARALGGAGLVMSEMLCVAPDARITPACAGLWSDEQRDAWARVSAFVHRHSQAKFGVQLGHAGRKGATHVPSEGEDEPLAHGAWPLYAASAIPYLPHSQIPHAMTADDMARVRDQFVHAATLAITTEADLLELHFAHGYLLSSFLSPLTNARTDDYGGDATARARYPLEIFRAVRDVWPSHLPVSVRLSCHDWSDGGNTADDAVQFARLFKDAGADLMDCSAGQVVKGDRPVYGRLFQTPFADRVRNEVGIPTMAVGAITDADQVNSIIAAGRADLCAIARPHLADSAWTLHESARLGFPQAVWPEQYRAGRRQYETLIARAQAAAATAAASGSTQ